LKSGKQHDSRQREGKRSGNLTQWRMGVFLSHNTTVKHQLERQVPSNYAVPDPMALTVSKALQAACPMHDTQGAGVVTEAHNPIVVA